MIYEAIAYKIIVTKRDMFYRNVSLFNTQTVLDSVRETRNIYISNLFIFK